MADPSGALREQVGAWLDRARAAGWLSDADLATFHAAERAAPGDLFVDPAARPLVVAFFGGTGVGKSTLLNRLAGGEVARVGVERPTSHEVSLYLHDAVALADLPAVFPVERVRIERHHDDRRHDVVWIDMPDIDSTATENRALALAWLPHIDLLIYVVSPERYRDDAGWRQLQERGHRHGWLFVMNRLDEGDPRQVEDFAAELHDAGFAEPVVVGTVSAGGGMGGPADGFADIEAAVQTVAAAHGVRELERLGQRARMVELHASLAGAAARLGDIAAWVGLGRLLEEEWQRARADVGGDLAWPIRAAAARVALRHGSEGGGLPGRFAGAVRRLRGKAGSSPEVGAATAPEEGEDADLVDQLWDAVAQGRLGRVVDRLEVEARRRGVAVTPLLARLQGVVDGAPAVAQASLATALGHALARPGTRVQRFARRVAKAAMVVLPAMAVARVAYDVVVGYGRGVAGEVPFLGLGFAVHAVLLVALAWFLPAVTHWLLRPDLHRAVVRGLTNGLGKGLDGIEEDLNIAFARATEEREELAAAVAELLAALDRQCHPGHEPPPPAVRRLIATAAK